ncbi:MAG TPA: NAD-dependent epimerase/dehydratase family protein [Candidatus Sulfotelmatobacter sp.]|nr:NAD-dependent epimerase/dehydratase family protein [Candidatus Sulfotelmatobacter sp.]
MRALVTGAAGFVGSHLCERLLRDGAEVVGLDAFVPNYPRPWKEANLRLLRDHARFRFVEGDLAELDLTRLLTDVEIVFHQAAMPGVRSSWGAEFQVYVDHNIRATQRLLEAAVNLRPLRRIVYASSSSVYGDAPALPLEEDAAPRPISPYGVTKLAAEHLCRLYALAYGLPTVSLRYFTVYGPRQRPDMAFHRFCAAILQEREIVVFSDGEQTRDFTYVDDAVEANLRAALRPLEPGAVINIGGGARISVRAALGLLETAAGRKARLVHREAQRGDMRHTYADTRRAQALLDFRPAVPVAEGLRRELIWMEEVLRAGAPAGA